MTLRHAQVYRRRPTSRPITGQPTRRLRKPVGVWILRHTGSGLLTEGQAYIVRRRFMDAARAGCVVVSGDWEVSRA